MTQNNFQTLRSIGPSGLPHSANVLFDFSLQAERERDITVEHLADIDRLVNESLQMLSRFQDLNTKILPLMEDYLIALRSRDNTPASLLRMDKNHEEEMINNYTSDMKAKIQGKYIENSVRPNFQKL